MGNARQQATIKMLCPLAIVRCCSPQIRQIIGIEVQEFGDFALPLDAFQHEVQARVYFADEIRRNERCRAVLTNDGGTANNVTMPQ
jgi:hypothetical protein